MKTTTTKPNPQPTETDTMSMATPHSPRHRPLRFVGAVVLAATTLSCTAQANNLTAKPGKPVTVYGFEATTHTGAAGVAAGKADLTAVTAKVADESGEVVVYRFGGSPNDLSTPASVTLTPKGDNDMFRENNKRNLLKTVTPQLAAALDPAGTSDDADVFGSLATFAATLHEQSGGRPDDGVSRRLVVRSRFAHRTGWADVTNTELDTAKIAEVMTWVKDRHLMPDLADTDVVLVGIGRGDDTGISAARAAQYRQLMEAWCHEARARTCTISTDLGAL